MSIPRIYHEENLQPGAIINLAAQAGKHLITVLRLHIGDDVILFNGHGSQYRSRLSAINNNRGILQVAVTVQNCEEVSVESPLKICLAQTVLRSEKMDYVIQKSVELGVTRIVPLITERTGVKLNAERLQSRAQHWQQIIISACEQCGRNYIPQLDPIMHFHDWLTELGKDTRPSDLRKFLLIPQAKERLADYKAMNKNILITIGAEGGFSDMEIALAERAGFLELQLGPRVLRTETAALATIAALQALWGDL